MEYIIITNQGVTIITHEPFINTSDGKTFTWTGSDIIGLSGIVSNCVKSFDEAVGIIIGLYGGRIY